MLQTKKINKEVVAVAYEPTEILVRKSEKQYFNLERTLVKLVDGKLQINKKVADEFGIKIEEIGM